MRVLQQSPQRLKALTVKSQVGELTAIADRCNDGKWRTFHWKFQKYTSNIGREEGWWAVGDHLGEESVPAGFPASCRNAATRLLTC